MWGRFAAHRCVPVVLALSCAAQALSGELAARVTAGDEPVPDAVVSLFSESPAAASPVAPAGTRPAATMRQRGQQFEPFVLPVQTGTPVSFPNQDDIRHHVFSFSQPKPFELRLYGRDQVPTIDFDKPGVVALGCNIHDNMRGYIYVLDTPYFAATDARGNARLSDVPAGRYSVRIWHPRLRNAEQYSRPLTIEAGPAANATFAVTLGPEPRQRPPDAERGSY